MKTSDRHAVCQTDGVDEDEAAGEAGETAMAVKFWVMTNDGKTTVFLSRYRDTALILQTPTQKYKQKYKKPTKKPYISLPVHDRTR
jgi:hypothetical protein